jgi:hypothetical protein
MFHFHHHQRHHDAVASGIGLRCVGVYDGHQVRGMTEAEVTEEDVGERP